MSSMWTLLENSYSFKSERRKSVDRVKMGEPAKEKMMTDITERSIRLQGMGYLNNKLQVQPCVTHFIISSPQKAGSG